FPADPEQLPMEGPLLLGAMALRSDGMIAIDATKLAINDFDGPRLRHRLPSALFAWPAFEPHGVALGTCGQRWLRVPAPGRLRQILGAPILRQAPDDRLLDETVLKDRAGVVEDQRIDLSRHRAQRAPHHLAIEAHALGRPSEDQARDFGLIPT